MVKYSIEKYSDKLINDIKPLIVRHYEEIALHKEYIPLDPDWGRYEKLATMNGLLIVTARDEDKLVGYSVFYISPMMHYKSTISASNDIIWLAPEYRKGMTGVRLIKESERALKELGITKILWHIKFIKDFRKILYRMGYIDEDAIVGKILKE